MGLFRFIWSHVCSSLVNFVVYYSLLADYFYYDFDLESDFFYWVGVDYS